MNYLTQIDELELENIDLSLLFKKQVVKTIRTNDLSERIGCKTSYPTQHLSFNEWNKYVREEVQKYRRNAS